MCYLALIGFRGDTRIKSSVALVGSGVLAQILRVYRIMRDHRFIKKITHPMMGFKAFYSAAATISGIETAHRIRKGQLSKGNIPAYQQLLALAGSFCPKTVRLTF